MGLQADTGSTLMTFRCGTAEVMVQGAVIATLAGSKGGGAIGTMTPSFKLKFDGKKGKQKPEEVEKGATETLTFLNDGSAEPASLKLSAQWTMKNSSRLGRTNRRWDPGAPA